MLFDEKTYVERLGQLSPVLFSDSTDVEIIQSLSDSDKTKIQLRNEDELAEQLDRKPSPSMRIM